LGEHIEAIYFENKLSITESSELRPNAG